MTKKTIENYKQRQTLCENKLKKLQKKYADRYGNKLNHVSQEDYELAVKKRNDITLLLTQYRATSNTLNHLVELEDRLINKGGGKQNG